VAMKAVKSAVKFAIANYAIPLIRRLRTVWKQNFADIVREVKSSMKLVLNRVQTAGKQISQFWNQYGTEIMTITKTVFDYLVLTIGTAMDAILTTIKTALAIFRGDWKQAFTYISEFVDRTLTKILNHLGGSFLKGLRATMSLIVKAIKAPFEAIYNFLIGNSIVPKTFNSIIRFLRGGFLPKLQTVLDFVYNQFTGIFRDIKSAITDTITNLVNSVLSAIGNLAGRMVDKMKQGVTDMKRAFNSAIPDELSIPSVTIGGQSVSLPKELGGGSVGIPSETIGGQSIDLPQLAEGGIVDSTTIAMIGEAGDEAVVPLDKLGNYLDTAYEAGTATVTETTPTAGSGTSSASFTAHLRVEGDGELAELIRENARLEIEGHQEQKMNRIARN
jgi:phage-related protein